MSLIWLLLMFGSAPPDRVAVQDLFEPARHGQVTMRRPARKFVNRVTELGLIRNPNSRNNFAMIALNEFRQIPGSRAISAGSSDESTIVCSYGCPPDPHCPSDQSGTAPQNNKDAPHIIELPLWAYGVVLFMYVFGIGGHCWLALERILARRRDE